MSYFLISWRGSCVFFQCYTNSMCRIFLHFLMAVCGCSLLFFWNWRALESATFTALGNSSEVTQLPCFGEGGGLCRFFVRFQQDLENWHVHAD